MKKLNLSQKRKREIATGYLFIFPLFLGLGIFHFYAFFNNIWISFTNKKALKDGIFVGLEIMRKLCRIIISGSPLAIQYGML